MGLSDLRKSRLLFCTGEGVGNVIQTIPVICTLKEVLGYQIDLWHAFGSFSIPKVIPYINKWIVGAEINNLDFSIYEGVVSTYWTRDHIKRLPLRLLNVPTPLSMSRSEVDTYMDIARDLGAGERDLIWHGECNYKRVIDEYDIVIHNGYNRFGSANWSIKSYPYYKELAKLLNGFKICSVGARDEYVEGTDNKTGLDLLTSLGIIKNVKLFIGNDSGLYHCANALGISNVVIFTATSIEKNYDPQFHKYSKLVFRDDLKCRPCQAARRWNKDCKIWECRNINPKTVFEIAINKLKGE